MAYIMKRGNKWQAQISWLDDASGKRKYKYKSGFGTKREAMQYARKMEIAKEESGLSDQDPTFVDYFNNWYKTYKENKISISTKRMYLKIAKYLSDFFKQEKISKITRPKYQRFINWYGKDHAKVTVQKTHSSIKACVQDAIYDHIVHDDFTSKIELIFDKNRTIKVEYLSVKEIQTLVKSLKDSLTPRYTGAYMVLTAIYTGMRLGEISALTWGDIDFKTHVITINKSYDYVGNRIKEPKTPSSVRTIRVNEDLLKTISELRNNHQHYIFNNERSQHISSNAVNHLLRRHLAKCGIQKEHFHFHSLRHSHVALLLDQGIDLYAISKRLGHSDMSTTAKKYAYLIEELKERSNDHIEETLNKLF